MLRTALFLAACLAPLSAPALAKQFTLVCHVTSMPSGKQFDRTITIDPDIPIVLDDALQYIDGAPTALGDDVEQFVHPGQAIMSWGYRRKSTSTNAVSTTPDFNAGTYVLQTDRSGESRGTCRKTAAAVS